MMRKEKKITGSLAGLCMLLAAVSAGPGLAEALVDLLGYGIYLGVFGLPVWYFRRGTITPLSEAQDAGRALPAVGQKKRLG